MRLPHHFRVALAGLLFIGVAGGQDTAVRKEFIYEHAPFPAAHASTLVEVAPGEFLAAWFGGTREGAPDVAIWMARRTAAGWSVPVEIAREPETPCWNPVLFHAKTGRLWLYFKYGPAVTSWTAARRYSDDGGKTWSAVEHLPAGIYGPIRTKPYVAPDGTIVSGTSVETYQSWAAWVERSTDNGDTWTRTGPITLPELLHATSTGVSGSTPAGVIQPTILAMDGGRPGQHLRMYLRSASLTGRICIADSADGGVSWTNARRLNVPNPNSGIDVVHLRDGRFVLIYNDATTGRTPLNLAESNDGEHFTNFAVLESGPGEFSYPALIQGSDGDLHMTYTWQRQRIRYATYPMAAIPR